MQPEALPHSAPLHQNTQQVFNVQLSASASQDRQAPELSWSCPESLSAVTTALLPAPHSVQQPFVDDDAEETTQRGACIVGEDGIPLSVSTVASDCSLSAGRKRPRSEALFEGEADTDCNQVSHYMYSLILRVHTPSKAGVLLPRLRSGCHSPTHRSDCRNSIA